MKEGEFVVLATSEEFEQSRGLPCDRCGGGAAAVFQRNDVPNAPPRRVCGDWWPAERAENIRLAIAEGALFSSWGHAFEVSPEWLVAFLDAVEAVLPSEVPVTDPRRTCWRAERHSAARELQRAASRVEGPIPERVRHFVERVLGAEE